MQLTNLPSTTDHESFIASLFEKNRGIFGDARMEGEEDGGDGGDGSARSSGRGYVPPATQEELEAILERRMARERGKMAAHYSDYDAIKAKAAMHDALELELGTTAEKAAAEARRAADP